MFVSKIVSKVLNKNFSEKKLLNILFSIKIENKIYHSLSTAVFVSPCVYKLIIYIYLFSYLQPALHKKVLFELDLNPRTASSPYGALTDHTTQYLSSI